MKFLIVKVKDRDLYFNADEMEGPYVCSTPMLMDKDVADSIMKYAIELYNYDTDEQFTNNDLEIREVEVNLI
jgi:hypothetical protein